MSHYVKLFSDGTRLDLGEGKYDYPLSMDLKITDYCNRECPFCHESSGKTGKHGNYTEILEKLGGLPEDTEIAIGGGNPLLHPDLEKLVSGFKDFGYTVNMTVRDEDLGKYSIPQGITALGISLSPGFKSPINIPEDKNVVAHLILGINSVEDYKKAKTQFSRILWLGFKRWGRNINATLPDLRDIRREIVLDLYQGRNITLAFDNLALEQLSLRSSLLEKEWSKFYLGPEFTCSMYVDGVKGNFSESSTSGNRVSWKNINLIDYWNAKDN